MISYLFLRQITFSKTNFVYMKMKKYIYRLK